MADAAGGPVVWAKDGLSIYPTWMVEPTVQSIVATLNMAIGVHHEYDVRFLHGGAMSKLYDVSFGGQAFVMRTESEVATLDWVRRHTRLPVPHVRAYDASRNNPLGYEWLLMTKLKGKPLSESWSSVTIGLKERIVIQIADFVASTFNQPFHDGIGSLFGATGNAGGHGWTMGESVSMAARLRFVSSDLALRLNATTDGDEKDTLRQMSDLTRRIEGLMPRFVSGSSSAKTRDTAPNTAGKQPTTTVLCHDGLSLDNILVDDDGILQGTCQFPAFLQQAHDRHGEPALPRYLIDDTGPPHPAYYRDLKQYEITRLRELFIEEILDRAPGFVDIWRDGLSANLRDFEAAIQNCDNEFVCRLLEEWVEAIEQGQDPARMPKRLHELLMG
ncbi:hypothetical protein F5Y14DRAFT_444572 [Nemania sp. NC0429]|nr:hypothetical protein F5Y14DRAFT_444572 [Nemania sp. NC0429]